MNSPQETPPLKHPKGFVSLQTRLTFTYTFVTVAALLAMELLFLVAGTLLLMTSNFGAQAYLRDVIDGLGSQARVYWTDQGVDGVGLQTWAEQLVAAGYASTVPVTFFDSPAAPLVPGQSFRVLATDGTVLSAVPPSATHPGDFTPSSGRQALFSRAGSGTSDPMALYEVQPDGNWLVAVPIRQDETVVAVGLLTIEPAPPPLQQLLPGVARVLFGSTALLIIGVTPFGAIFGSLMAHRLTRRLRTLADAATAWSRGDFSVVPVDGTADELGVLGMHLRMMAEQLEMLLQSRQQLAKMQERHRMARDLHDTVKQQNFATLMQMRAAKNLLGPSGTHEATRNHLNAAEALLKQSQQELQTIIAELRPVALQDTGLAPALQRFGAQWQELTQIRCEVTVHYEHPLPLEMEEALYRVTQEALANVSRHSRARSVSIVLRYGKNTVHLTIQDDGEGFDPRQTAGGVGLSAMRQRIMELHGTLTLTSEVGRGTTLLIEVPTGAQP